MKKTTYCPEKGDLIWLQFTPHAGREQAGRRPAVVLSPRAYNSKTQLALVCPVTSKIKGYPFEVILPEGLPIAGAVLADHVRNLDWASRNSEFIAHVSTKTLSHIVERIEALISIQSPLQ